MNNQTQLFQIPRILDRRGNLSVIEQIKQVPFEIKRAFWIYDVPGDSTRGGHAFRETDEFVVALSGSFDVVVNDGEKEEVFHLSRSYYGVYVPKMTWRQMRNFSTNSVALVLSSTDYDANDYIRDFDAFVAASKNVMLRGRKENVKFENIESIWNIQKSSVFDCSVIELQKKEFPAGNLTPVQSNVSVPFDIKRVFYLYDIPGGESRGAHAHKKCHQFLIAASGAFEVVLDDGANKRTVLLNRPFYGLHIPPGIWAAEQGFSSGSVCLVLTSEKYDAADYIRDYNEFLKYRENDGTK